MNHRGSAVPFQKSSHHGKQRTAFWDQWTVYVHCFTFSTGFSHERKANIGTPTKSKRRGRKDSFLTFDDANKFVQLLTTLSTALNGNHFGEILALRGGSLGRVGVW